MVEEYDLAIRQEKGCPYSHKPWCEAKVRCSWDIYVLVIRLVVHLEIELAGNRGCDDQ